MYSHRRRDTKPGEITSGRAPALFVRKQTVSNVMPASVSLQSDTLHARLSRMPTSRDDVFPTNGFTLPHKQSLRASWWAVYYNENEKSTHKLDKLVYIVYWNYRANYNLRIDCNTEVYWKQACNIYQRLSMLYWSLCNLAQIQIHIFLCFQLKLHCSKTFWKICGYL